ncbi:hypothetical protein C0Q70_14328 [Pomacea canaliculata]|uniref:Uncharacterized protein n=1 Tax=Pomacea canaliculata TaxID=400727 RepID=A0A2T7NZQ5_POMCA|nr:hypothetical protein C0Q70_14328 [Pomacea canaliculata]
MPDERRAAISTVNEVFSLFPFADGGLMIRLRRRVLYGDYNPLPPSILGGLRECTPCEDRPSPLTTGNKSGLARPDKLQTRKTSILSALERRGAWVWRCRGVGWRRDDPDREGSTHARVVPVKHCARVARTCATYSVALLARDEPRAEGGGELY